MKIIGIDIGKNSHKFAIIDKDSGEVISKPSSFKNNKEGFEKLLSSCEKYSKDELLFGMEDTGHYHFVLLKYLLDQNYKVALINPTTTDMTRRLNGDITKTDALDAILICDVLSGSNRNKLYRVTKIDSFDLIEQRQLTRQHHDLKEEYNQLTNKLQAAVDYVFPEFNSLFKSKYGIVYNSILKDFGSAQAIAQADIRTLRKYFDIGRGKHIELTPEKLKEAAKNSIAFYTQAKEIEVKHLMMRIEEINKQIDEVDKKIEEFSLKNNSPILTIPGISHFSGTSILAEIGDIHNFSTAQKIIKYAGVAPLTYESSQFTAKHTAITKKGNKYLRKTLYQIIMVTIKNNPIFHEYYMQKVAQGKGHRCAQGHCIRKLLRVIYHVLTTNTAFDSSMLS